MTANTRESATSHTSINSDIQERMQQLLTELQLDDAPAGGALVVYQAGVCIAQAAVGMAQTDLAWQPDTLAINFSTGKGVLATLVHVLVSQQLLDYDTAIASYWPDFSAKGKADITLRMVMSHRADLFSINSIDTHNTAGSDALRDWQLMLQKVAVMPITPPEDAHSYDSAYSALVYGWVLGGVIEAVTKMSLAQALRQYLTEPLSIADSCYFGVPSAKVADVARLAKNFAPTSSVAQPSRRRRKPVLKVDSQQTLETYAHLPTYQCWMQHTDHNRANSEQTEASVHNDSQTLLDTAQINRLYFDSSQLNLRNYKAALIPNNEQPIDYYNEQTLQAVIPAANGVASAQALATIYAMLANGGVWQGKTLIDAATFEQLSTVQVTGQDAVMPADMQWRLGYHKLLSVCTDAGTGFGHMGYNGSVAWCDPARQLSFAFIHNFDITMLNDVRQFALTESLLALID